MAEIRNKIADYLEDANGEYAFCGVGFNTLDENPGAQTDTKVYICDESASSNIKGYQPTFSFDTDLIKEEKAVMMLYEIGRNRKTGTDAELNYVRVELFKPVEGESNTFAARKFLTAAEIASFAGGGGETIKVTGTLHNRGDFIDGTFNTKTRVFTAFEDIE